MQTTTQVRRNIDIKKTCVYALKNKIPDNRCGFQFRIVNQMLGSHSETSLINPWGSAYPAQGYSSMHALFVYPIRIRNKFEDWVRPAASLPKDLPSVLDPMCVCAAVFPVCIQATNKFVGIHARLLSFRNIFS